MILYFAPGARLGNLLFQITYLESIRKPRERVLAINLFGVPKMFRGLRRYYNTDFRPFTRFIDKFVSPWVGAFFRHTRLVSSHIEWRGILTKTKGWLPLTYVEGYFQQPLAGEVPFQFPGPILEKARRYLEEAAQGRTPVFVHVRRGDYLHYLVKEGIKPLLGEAYYRTALGSLTTQAEDLHYVFLGDSGEWCRQRFPDILPQTISTLSPLEDLALMSLCAGGVVSNSTFAWWGAALCRRTLPVYGPLYWLGWQARQWYPRGIETPWMTYLEGSW